MANFTSIEHFIQNSFLSQGGFFKPSRFQVEFIPTGAKLGEFTDIDLFTWLKENIITASVPQFALNISETSYRMSVNGRNPEGELSMSFYESFDLRIRRNIHQWISNTVEKQGIDHNFKRLYVDDVKCDIKVYPLGGDGNKIKMGNGDEVFDYFQTAIPTSVSGLNYNIATENEAGTTTINFKYHYHSVITIPAQAAPSAASITTVSKKIVEPAKPVDDMNPLGLRNSQGLS